MCVRICSLIFKFWLFRAYDTTDELEGIMAGRISDGTLLYTRVSEYYNCLRTTGYNRSLGPVLNHHLLKYSVLFVLLNYFS